MKQFSISRFAMPLILTAVVSIGVATTAIAQDTTEAPAVTPATTPDVTPAAVTPETPAQTAPTPEAANATEADDTTPKYRKRLPNYYNQVVTDVQKEKIYAIQKSYFARIMDLRRQLMKLETERNREIEALLSTEQLDEVKNIAAKKSLPKKAE